MSASTAFIGSASILGMSPALEKFKDPRILTSFGLGQLILDAASRGYRQIMLGLGGTSTVDGGLGMAQALGVTMMDGSGGKIVPLNTHFFAGSDLARVSSLDFSDVANELREIKFEVLADANLTLKQMTTATPQKIGTPFSASRTEILDQLYRGIFQYGEVVEVISGNTGLRDKHFFGAAGGILLSVAALFEYEVKLGTDFLFDFLGIEEKIVTSDLVITGEGKFDNSLHGKGPIGVSRIARKHDIPVLYLCGSVDSTLKDYFEDYLTKRVPDYLRDQGIHGMVSGHNLYDNLPGWDKRSNLDRVNAYQHHTPLIWRQALKQYFQLDSR
jgi:glycerate kinase